MSISGPYEYFAPRADDEVLRIMRCSEIFFYRDGYCVRINVRDDYYCSPYFDCELHVGVCSSGVLYESCVLAGGRMMVACR